ncbi:RING-H2 finger protein ATL79-like [Musa acuminata AAA Group]|uniref:RING-H2 finger protein ATL79-like n=1 Tax=Musa acuminata AAA Group TaxID=214697 RepID=UPI0031D73FED
MPVPHADDAILHPPPPTRASASNATSDKWGPYSGASDFGASMALVLAALFCTILLALSLGAAIRLLFCRRHRRGTSEEPEEKPAAAVTPTMLFSAAGTMLAGMGADCAICLAEFCEGDPVRVLPACNHGFHVRCIDRWLAARSSCPTCRADANPEERAQAQAQAQAQEVAAEGV